MKPWTPDAKAALEKEVEQYRRILTEKAEKVSRGEEITRDDLYLAHQILFDKS